MTHKDLAEAVAMLATFATLPEITPSHLGWLVALVVLVLLTRNRGGRPPSTK